MKKAILALIVIVFIFGCVQSDQQIICPDGSVAVGDPAACAVELDANITNFEECIEAGYPTLESYPRQCKDIVNDKTFTEEVEIDIGSEPVTYLHPALSGLDEKDCFDNICVTRDDTGPVIVEGDSNWGCGLCEGSLDWYGAMDKNFQQDCVQNRMVAVVEMDLCLGLTDTMWDIDFNSYFGGGESGEFSYTRTLFTE